MTPETVTLLIVDDDEIDVETITRSLELMRIANPTRIARDGIEAFEILRGSNGKDQVRPPYIILLDINMPRMNGLEFLKNLRADPKLTRAVVFVLTTSDDDKDILKAYDSHVSGYMLKNKAGSDFTKALELLDHYWRYVELPVSVPA